MEKKLYQTPHIDIVEVETVMPIATSLTSNGKGGVQSDLGDIENGEGMSQDEMRSSNFFNHWADED